MKDLKIIYVLFVRSILEQSAVVWHSSLTEDNRSDLEKVQKSAIRVMLQDNYNGYKNGLAQLGLDDLDSRRNNLCLDFAKKCAKSEKMCHMFPKNTKNHNMDTQNNEVYMVQHANTGRLQNSSIIYMQKLLNSEEREKT